MSDRMPARDLPQAAPASPAPAAPGLESSPCPICGCGNKVFLLKADYPVVRCADCGMVWADPRPDAAARRRLYGRDYYVFDRRLEAAHCAAAARDVERYLGRAPEAGPRRFLDVGCSTGYLLEAAKAAGWDVEGVEFSPDAAERARRRTGCAVFAGELEAARLPAGRFQAITLLDVLEHIPEPVESLREAARLLAPGGRLVVECPNWWELYRRFTGERWVGFNPFHLHFFSPRTLARAFELAGLEVAGVRTTPLDPFTPEGLVRLKGRKEAPGKPEPRSAAGAGAPTNWFRCAAKRALNAPFNRVCEGLGWGRQVVVIGRPCEACAEGRAA